MTAKQTLYLDATRTKAVPEGDKDARFLLVREGGEIPDTLVEKYDVSDLVSSAAKGAKKAEPEKAEPEHKQPKSHK